MAAAHRLQRLMPQAELQLFEARDRLGGPLHTIRSGDSIVEQGADSFQITKPWAAELCRELGLADQIIPTSEQHRRAFVVRDGGLLPVPDGFVLMQPHNLRAIWRSPVLSLRGKLRISAERFVTRPSAVMAPDYDESVASFAIRRLGQEAYQRLVQPLLAGIFVADAQRLSLAATYPEFLQAEREYGSLWCASRARLKVEHAASAAFEGAASQASAARYGQFVTLRRGVYSLIEALVDSLPKDSLQLGAKVKYVACDSDERWAVTANDGGPHAFDGLILAASAPQAGRLLADCDAELGKQLMQIEYASSVVVTLVYNRDQIAHPLDGFGAVVPAAEKRATIALSFLTVKFPGHAPPNKTAIRVFMGGALNPQMVDRPDDELIAFARQEVETLLGCRGAPLETHVACWRESMPQYHVGHLKLIESIEQRVASHPRLHLAGSAYRGVGIPQCVHSGRAAAERLAEELSNGVWRRAPR